jgi:aspartyl/glutamyl-tRNA(Asn/Gln) amidotransferase C subunit
MEQKKLIEKLETLSKIKLKKEEKEKIENKLEEIIGFLDNLSTFDKTIEKDNQDNKSIYRMEDCKLQSVSIEDFYNKNNKVENGSFKVPKIL